MKILPTGITGFWKTKDKILETDRKLIDKTIKNLKTNSNYWKIKLEEQEIDNNYYQILVKNKYEHHKIGINSSYPIYCGIKNSEEIELIEFYDLPEEITSLIPKELTELKTTFLNEHLTKEHKSNLNIIEKEQIEYWETIKVGHVIFNKYD